MAVIASRFLAAALVATAGLGLGDAASARDPVAGALLGAGAGAIIGHGVGGPEAAVAGGIIGAVAGAAVASHGVPAVSVHYGGGYGGYGHVPPPVYYPRPPRGPVYVVPPPAIVFSPSLGHGYWHHGFDAWGRPLPTWIPAPAPRRHYAPPHHRHRGHGYGNGYGGHHGW